MSVFRVKLFQLPIGAEFVMNDVTFVRGDYLAGLDSYRCRAKDGSFGVVLHKFTFVEPVRYE